MNLILRAVVVGVLVLPLSVQAERYRTWLDKDGVVRHEVVRETTNPLLQRAEELRKSSKAQQESNTGPTEQELVNRQLLDEHSGNEQNVDPGTLVDQTSSNENELADQKANIQNLPMAGSAPRPRDPSTFSTPEQFSTEEYIDAAELERNGFVRDTAEGRFYLWVDAQGIVHNSPYPPEDDQTVDLPFKSEEKFSPFQINERLTPSKVVVSANVDEFARKLFKLDELPSSNIHNLSTGCCRELPLDALGKIDPEEGYLVEFGNRRESYAFATGESVYEVVQLPDTAQDYVLSIRSFVNKSVFIPTLVFMNEKMEPTRLVRNVVHDYTSENWFRYGYLEGWVKVEALQNDKFLMILTVPEDLNRVTVIPRKKKEVAVEHGQQGMLHLSVVK